MRFSIIIPTFNRPALLDRCLTALEHLNYLRRDFEVWVVDDGSVPAPDVVIARHAETLNLHYRKQNRQGPARARNLALRSAKGDFVVFTDDDCVPDKDWLLGFDRLFQLHPDSGAGGRIVSAPESGIFGEASQLLVSFLYGHFDLETGAPRFFCSNNFAFGRGKLLLIGGFAETFALAAAEDRDLCARWDQSELRFVEDAVVVHFQDLSFSAFLRQHFRYGQGAFQFWTRQKANGRPGNRLESWRFYRNLLSFPFLSTPLVRAVPLSLLLGISQAATAAGYFSERQKRRPRLPI